MTWFDFLETGRVAQGTCVIDIGIDEDMWWLIGETAEFLEYFLPLVEEHGLIDFSAMTFTAALPYGLMVSVKAFLRSRAFHMIMRYGPVSVCKVSSESNHRSCDNGYRCLLDPHLSLILSVLVYQWTPFSLNQYVLVLLYVRLRCSWTGVSCAVSGVVSKLRISVVVL